MGHPRKARKQYDTPSHPWNADRIKSENKLVVKYGLRTKKEIWKAETTVKRYRRDARFLLGMDTEHAEVEKLQLLNHIIRIGMLKADGKLEDIFDLNSGRCSSKKTGNCGTQPWTCKHCKTSQNFHCTWTYCNEW